MSRHKLFFCSVCIFILKCVGAQNLVINGSFEDVNICTEFHAPCCPSAWFSAKILSGNTGYETTFGISPYRGKHLLAIPVASKAGNNRQYWQTMLASPVIKDQEYSISVNLTCSEVGPNLNDLGFFFSDGFVVVDSDSSFHPGNYISLLGGEVTQLKKGWFNIKKKFTATAASQFLLIGNFSSVNDSTIFKERNIINDPLVLAIDELSVTPVNKADVLSNHIKDFLYEIKPRHSVLILQPHFNLDSFRNKNVAVIEDSVAENIADTIRLSNINFKFNSSELTDPNILNQYKDLFTQKPVKTIQVIGYTDSVGTNAYNLKLSAERAFSISKLITGNFGIEPEKIQTTGKGVSSLYTELEKNRRVDIIILR